MDKYLDLACELKKTVAHESDDYTNCNESSEGSHRRIGKRTTSRLRNEWTSGDNSNNSIVEIG